MMERLIWACFLFLSAGQLTEAIVELSALFSDGMVLQGEPLRTHVFGKTDDSVSKAIFVTVTCPDFQEEAKATMVCKPAKIHGKFRFRIQLL